MGTGADREWYGGRCRKLDGGKKGLWPFGVGWSEWFDITYDPFAPQSWNWIDVVFMLRLEFRLVPRFCRKSTALEFEWLGCLWI
jgi:hypothetical protein